MEPHQKLVKLRTEEFEQTRKIAIENSKNQKSDENNTDMSLAEKGKKVFLKVEKEA